MKIDSTLIGLALSNVSDKGDYKVLIIANQKIDEIKDSRIIKKLNIDRVVEADKDADCMNVILKDISAKSGSDKTGDGVLNSDKLFEFMDKIPEDAAISFNPGFIYMSISFSKNSDSWWVQDACVMSFMRENEVIVTLLDAEKNDKFNFVVYENKWVEVNRKSFSDDRKSFSCKREEYKYIRDNIKKQVGPNSSIYKFYEKVVENMKDCDVLKMEEVLDPNHYQAIMSGKIVIEPNHCWSNSYAVLTSPEFDDIKNDLFYCEGFADDGSGYPIEHGWLRYKDCYFDPTAEVIYPGENVFHDYTSIIELSYDEAVKMIDTTRVHGYNNLAMIAKYYNF